MNSNQFFDQITWDEIRRCIMNAESDVLQVVEDMIYVKVNLAQVKKCLPTSSCGLSKSLFGSLVARPMKEIADFTKKNSERLARFQQANAALSEKILLLKGRKVSSETVPERTEINKDMCIKSGEVVYQNNVTTQAEEFETTQVEEFETTQVEEFETKKMIDVVDCDSDEREQSEKRKDWDMENKEKVWLLKKDENLMREWLRTLPQESRNSENRYWLVSRETKTSGNSSWKTEELHKWLKKMVLPEEPRNPLQMQNMNTMDFQCCDDTSSVSESITVAQSESSLSSEFSVISSPNSCCDTSKWLIPKHTSKDKNESFGCNTRNFSMDIEDLDNNRMYLLNRQQCTNQVGNVTDEDRDRWLVKRAGPNTSVYSIADSCVANETCADFSGCLCDENCLKMAMLQKMRPVRNKNRMQADELAAFRPYRVVSPIIDMLHSSSKQYLKRKTQNGEEKS
jgi:hypothetical protein